MSVKTKIQDITFWFQFAMMILRYGKEFVEWAIDAYRSLEEKWGAKKGKEKAVELDKLITPRLEQMGVRASAKRVARVRETIHKSEKRRSGKTAGK